MDNGSVQLVGGPCGQHGPYTFYKAFTYSKDGVKRVITLSEFFFVKLWMDSDLVCIGELQMLWVDKNSEQVLASLRLYFLPENTPEGRMDHGEDEVLAISEKVVLRVEDLITWVTIDAEWTWGRLAKSVETAKDLKTEDGVNFNSLSEALREITEAQCEKRSTESKCNNDDKAPSVVILSYPRYCRYRAMMRRLEGVEDSFLKMKVITELGGFSVPSKNTRILFCKDTFDYPELEGHELLCNHLAPKLKGRPRGKRKKRSVSPGSESNESECSMYSANLSQPSTSGIKSLSHDYPNGARPGSITRRSTRSSDNSEGKAFVKKLTSFMKSNHSPIGRIPSLGYKELDLHHFFTKVQKLGGYDVVTSNRIWKSIFEELGGSHASTSAATVMRRHYERFLLPFERHVKGEEYKPLPVSARRRLKSKASRTSTSDADTSEGTSGSENSTPAPSSSNSIRSDSSSTDIKETISEKGKTSSLRSVRVKSERAREARREAERELKETIDIDAQPTTPIATIPKEEPIEIKEEPPKPNINNEPITTAATPNNKYVPDKSPSPIESKEIPPIFDQKLEPKLEQKPEQKPEIIDLDSEVYKNISTNNNNESTEEVIVDVKKQKLDILKQGGLEVTPVRRGEIKELNRPSVIQQIATHRVEIIPNNSKAVNDRKSMPPPLAVKKLDQTPEKKFISNGRNPPKVVQSKSIYVPSEKTIYGDPKDFQPMTIHQIQAPISLTSRNITTGGGILDLTVKSPQKPQVSNYPLGLSESDFYSRSFVRNPPKMNSNLEITLVKNDMKKPSPVFHKPAIPRKRSYSSNHPAKIPRMDEKATISPQQRNFQVPQPPQPLFYGQNFNSANTSNKLPPYFPASMDLYQNMLQMYLPAMYRMQNPEQLQLYHEILAQNARVRGASYSLPQDSESPKK